MTQLNLQTWILLLFLILKTKYIVKYYLILILSVMIPVSCQERVDKLNESVKGITPIDSAMIPIDSIDFTTLDHFVEYGKESYLRLPYEYYITYTFGVYSHDWYIYSIKVVNDFAIISCQEIYSNHSDNNIYRYLQSSKVTYKDSVLSYIKY